MASFSEIMTRGMVFYDEEYLAECKEFCRIRDIHFLPHIHSHNLCYYYDRDTGNFKKQQIQERQMVRHDDPIFDTNLINDFKAFQVLFVEKSKRIVGIVHMSDYNRGAVYDYLYKKLFLLEKGLVHLIIQFSGLRRRELFKFLGKSLPEGEGDKVLTQKDFRGKGISLKTILELVHAYEMVKIREADIHKIIAVRNKIAHSDQLVPQSASDPMQFSSSAFSHLVHGVNSLEVALRQVGNRLYFMQGTMTDDFSAAVMPLEDYLFT